MDTKSFILSFIFLGSLISCNNKVLETPTVSVAPSLKSASLNYYVATTGSDSNAGTLASPLKPFRSSKCCSRWRHCNCEDGTYTITPTIALI